MTVLLAAMQVGLGTVLAAAAVGKMFDRDRFVGTLRLSGFPASASAVLSVVVPIAEVIGAFGLVFARGALLPIVFGNVALLLAAFTVWLASLLIRKITVACGCFGRSRDQIGAAAIARNLMLLSVALFGVGISNAVSTPIPPFSLALLIAATGGFFCIALAVYAREAAPYLVLKRQE